jgi:2-methylcitrate dehydratase PrpD
VFGAAAAAARLLNLTVDQTVHALGIAASEAGGVRANFGTMTKPLHAGETNRAGVLAAMLAGRGFTASSDGIEGRYGWNDAFAAGDCDLTKATKGLGSSFAIEEGVDVKRYPCCGANHAALNGFRRVLIERALELADVALVEVEQSAYSVNDILIYPWPATGLEGKFSLAYNVAAALADGTVTIDTFTDERVRDLAPYRERVRIIPSDDDRKEVLVRVHTTGGEVFELTQPSGMPAQPGGRRFPLSDAELYAKFGENASRAKAPADVAALLRGLDTLGDAKTLTPLTDLLL